MPKSKQRRSKKTTRSDAVRGRADARSHLRAGQPSGLLPSSEGPVLTLLNSDRFNGDQLVELLLPLLWRRRPDDITGNSSVDSAMVLLAAYGQLGIPAEVRCVDVVIANQVTGKHTIYGRPDPCWNGTTFDGHCVLVLPQSGRILDATVEQFPEARRPGHGIVFGRIAFSTSDSVPPTSMMPLTDVPEGGHMAVARDDLLLLYTTTGPHYRDVVTSAPAVIQAAGQYLRTGVNLASHALTLLRIPDVAAKIPRASYPRVHALLDTIGDADFITDSAGNFHFVVPIDGVDTDVRLDDIPVPAPTTSSLTASTRRVIPYVGFDARAVTSILKDVDTEARVILHPTEAMGGGTGPVVLFEPRFAVGARPAGAGTIEVQSAGIIAAGFARFHPQSISLPRLRGWSVRRTLTGLELWDQGGVWARADLAVNDAWLQAATASGMVRVIYGVRVGVRRPDWAASYGDVERDAELMASRGDGTVAVAEIPWAGGSVLSGVQQRLRRLRPGNR